MLLLSRRAGLRHLAALCAFGTSFAIAADAFPTKPVTIVVPFSAGSGVDYVARLLAERLAQKWSTAVTVDNRLGAGGNLGCDFVAKAKPDGHTILFTGPPLYINEFLYKNLPYSPMADFKPVVKVSESPFVLLVAKSAPVHDLKDLIALAKAKPGILTYSSGGNGSTPHLAGSLFNSIAGTDIVHVPYKSTSQSLTDVLGGQVFMTFGPVIAGAQVVKGGLAKAIAVTGNKRASSLPDVPTLAELGMSGFQIATWNGALVPAATPDAVVNAIATAILDIVRDPAVVKAIAANGLDMDVMPPKAMVEYVAAEQKKWQKLVASTGVKMD